VIGFFVLSGYLVGRLIIEKMDSGNFLAVLPAPCLPYLSDLFLTSAVLLAIGAALAHKSWVHTEVDLPAYPTSRSCRNAFILTRESNGLHWLSPTWTLALEGNSISLRRFSSSWCRASAGSRCS
jgi:peptidoglycan/LPS O-acetylase OafA/YrhL